MAPCSYLYTRYKSWPIFLGKSHSKSVKTYPGHCNTNISYKRDGVDCYICNTHRSCVRRSPYCSPSVNSESKNAEQWGCKTDVRYPGWSRHITSVLLRSAPLNRTEVTGNISYCSRANNQFLLFRASRSHGPLHRSTTLCLWLRLWGRLIARFEEDVCWIKGKGGHREVC